MQPTPIAQTDAAVFGRLIKPNHGDFSPTAAREILSLQFDDDDKARMHQLSLKAQEGTLTPDEQAEIESYRRAGSMLGVLWSKARLSLIRAGLGVANGHHT
ncbi:hypothetical protein V5E97_10725 [Singulisphaera sp. Ch08]|uniref:Extradiol ring-cleavage dioxygenase LigAB LigA subunit domain-containing protein n=1 Tax=Singulisphaera sp. Ch08 TaxID=3120278 RepID=A0AAU7CM39_9BACT